jgi:predicted permease
MFTLIFNQLLKMLFIMLLAYFCYKIGLITQEGNRTLSNLLLMVVNPCLIITVYQTPYDPALIRGLMISFAAAAAAHILGILMAHFLIPAGKNPEYAIERIAAVYSNCGFIGIPLINSVLGSDGVFYLTAYMTVFNILTWTHSLILLNGTMMVMLFSGTRLSNKPMMIGVVIAVVLYFARIQLPSVLLDSMNYIADMNTPLAMIIAGVSVAQTDPKKIFTKLHVYWTTILKLILIPFAVLLLLAAFRTEHDIAYTTLIAAACPTGATLTMMAIQFNKNYQYASEIFAFTTVCSIATIPFMTFLAGFFF